MSTTEKQWKVIVDLLQCMTAGQFKTQAASDALVKVVNLLEPMARQPKVPAETWTKLIVGLKVGSSLQLLSEQHQACQVGPWSRPAVCPRGLQHSTATA